MILLLVSSIVTVILPKIRDFILVRILSSVELQYMLNIHTAIAVFLSKLALLILQGCTSFWNIFLYSSLFFILFLMAFFASHINILCLISIFCLGIAGGSLFPLFSEERIKELIRKSYIFNALSLSLLPVIVALFPKNILAIGIYIGVICILMIIKLIRDYQPHQQQYISPWDSLKGIKHCFVKKTLIATVLVSGVTLPVKAIINTRTVTHFSYNPIALVISTSIPELMCSVVMMIQNRTPLLPVLLSIFWIIFFFIYKVPSSHGVFFLANFSVSYIYYETNSKINEEFFRKEKSSVYNSSTAVLRSLFSIAMTYYLQKLSQGFIGIFFILFIVSFTVLMVTNNSLLKRLQ